MELRHRVTLAASTAGRASVSFARKVGAVSFAQYAWANIWSLLPVAAAFVVLGVAQNVLVLPSACGDAAPNNVNWLLCATDANPVGSLLDKEANEVRSPDGIQLPADVAQHVAQGSGLPADVSAAAREAKARLIWASSYGVLMAIALLSAAMALPYIWQAVAQHRSARGLPGFPWRYFLQFIAVSLVIALIGLEVVIWGTSRIFLRDPPPFLSLFDFLNTNRAVFKDGMMNWLGKYERQMNHQVDIAVLVLTIACSLIATLVSSSLYQGPDDDEFRRQAVPQPQDAAYVRYLGRSFGRLKIAIYLGAALLVTTTAELAARYAWPLALLPTSDDATKSLAELGQQFATQIGFGFTLLLAALYFPAAAILRQRGRDFYRYRNPQSSLQDQEKFLSDQGLTLKVSSAYGDFLALLAPAGVASASHLFSLLP